MGAAAENGLNIAEMSVDAAATVAPQADGAPVRAADRPHNPLDPEAFYSPEHLKERQERQARRDALKGYRKPIETLPLNHCWEIPGR